LPAKAATLSTPLNLRANDPFAGKKLGDTWAKGALGTQFLWIAGGRYRMGSTLAVPDEEDERPVDVELTYGLWVQKHELTQGEWRQIVGLMPWAPFADKRNNDRNAATHMTWDEAVDYCQRLTDRDRRAGSIPIDWEYRLPTEAEWEYFCRAGTHAVYCYGDNAEELAKYAWWKANTQDVGEGYAHEVGKLLPNAWGLHDVHGNVFEYCYDSYLSPLPGGRDPVVADPPIAGKVCRGGGWAYYGTDSLECSDRAILARNVRRNRHGIRLVVAPVSAISAAGYGRSPSNNTHPSSPVEDLSDGKRWTVLPDDRRTGWQMSGSTITAVSDGRLSYAWTKQSYENFELTMEVNCADGGNAGVVLRALQPHATFQNVFEVHFGGGRDSMLPGTDHPSCGGLYLSDEQQPPNDPGGDREWMHSHDFGADASAFQTNAWTAVKIRLVGQELAVEINGQQVFWRNLEDMMTAYPHFSGVLAQRSGPIGLQSFLGKVQYRNLRIQPLRLN
ncbi:MAG: SUMF1/EgtB/PvdO family nonheme iron enzyme, partial [Planctomycetaceae bacterium]|nr:SUMF1/EgtB/PvdO family nonheme iron enzyme [Planctomycetaceae bacterium]